MLHLAIAKERLLGRSDSEHGNWQAAKIFVPDGHHLRVARDSTGAVRTLLFENGTNKLAGPPLALLELRNLEEDQSLSKSPAANRDSTSTGEFVSELLAVALVAAGTAVIEVGTPLFLDWWSDRAWPAMKLRWSKRGSATIEATTAENVSPQALIAPGSEGAAATPQTDSGTMTLAEARARQIAMLAAVRFLVEQWQALNNARIVADPPSLGTGDRREALTSDRIVAGVRAIVDSSRALIDEDTATKLRIVLKDLPVRPVWGLTAHTSEGEDDAENKPSWR